WQVGTVHRRIRPRNRSQHGHSLERHSQHDAKHHCGQRQDRQHPEQDFVSKEKSGSQHDWSPSSQTIGNAVAIAATAPKCSVSLVSIRFRSMLWEMTRCDLIIHANRLTICDNCQRHLQVESRAMPLRQQASTLDYTVSAEMVQGLIDCAMLCGVPRTGIANLVHQPRGSKSATMPPARYAAQHVFTL